MNIEAALQKIYSKHQFNIKLGLERINKFLAHIGNPHLGLRYFHVAGSNGKGSTASFIASILMEAGFNVGLYTSPHFIRFNERIKINVTEIDDEYIAKFISDNDKFIDNNELTFFEITTALAFKYFSEKKPDYVVLETGLGGRLDATNVINPLASVITTIGLEHTNILGESIELIAAEKAGIIKPNLILVTGLMNDAAIKVIHKKSVELNCRHFRLCDVLSKNVQSITLTIDEKNYHLYRTGLNGYHQLINAALAIYTVNCVMGLNSMNVFNNGICNVVKNTGIEGRYEIVNHRPKIIFDSAHNPDGVQTFVDVFAAEYSYYAERQLIFGVMKDKDISAMLKLLNRYFDKIYAVKIPYDRAASIDDIVSMAHSLGIEVDALENPIEHINSFMNGEENRCLVVLGSMYLIGEIKSNLLNN